MKIILISIVVILVVLLCPAILVGMMDRNQDSQLDDPQDLFSRKVNDANNNAK